MAATAIAAARSANRIGGIRRILRRLRDHGPRPLNIMTRDDWLFFFSLVWFVSLLAAAIWMLFA